MGARIILSRKSRRGVAERKKGARQRLDVFCGADTDDKDANIRVNCVGRPLIGLACGLQGARQGRSLFVGLLLLASSGCLTPGFRIAMETTGLPAVWTGASASPLAG